MATLSFILQRFDAKLCEQYLEAAILVLQEGANNASIQETQDLSCLQLKIRTKTLSGRKAKSRAISILENQNKSAVWSYVASVCKFIVNSMLIIQYKESRSEIMTAIETLIFCSKRMRDVPALSLVRKQFKRHFGKTLVEKAAKNANGSVKDSVILRLSNNFITSENIEALLLAQGYSSPAFVGDQAVAPLVPAGKKERIQTTKCTIDYQIQTCPSSISKISKSDEGPLKEEKPASTDWENLPTAFLSASVPLSIPPTVQSIAKKSDTADCDIRLFSPTLPIYVFQSNPDLEIGFDTRTRNPLYVLERLNNSLHGKKRQKTRPPFFEDERLLDIYRSKLHHYFRSGYDRGHLAPAADFVGQQVCDTFVLSNISPQLHSMNCSIWKKLENRCRHVAHIEFQNNGGSTFIVTGPLWMPKTAQTGRNKFEYSFPAIGTSSKSLVQVPTHFFKILAVLSNEKISKFGCFVVPNKRIGEGEAQSLHQYVTKWTDMEAMSGIQFFPNLTNESGWKEHADRLAQQMSEGQWKQYCRSSFKSSFRRRNKIMSAAPALEHLVLE